MSESVQWKGQTLYAPVLACRPVRPADYPPEQREAWDRVLASGVALPPIYPGSHYVFCEKCGVKISLGPRQQEAREVALMLGLEAHVLCMLDAATMAASAGDDATLAHLGNPFQQRSFTCPHCGATSHNPNDVREGYCGRCHDWTQTS